MCLCSIHFVGLLIWWNNSSRMRKKSLIPISWKTKVSLVSTLKLTVVIPLYCVSHVFSWLQGTNIERLAGAKTLQYGCLTSFSGRYVAKSWTLDMDANNCWNVYLWCLLKIQTFHKHCDFRFRGNWSVFNWHQFVLQANILGFFSMPDEIFEPIRGENVTRSYWPENHKIQKNSKFQLWWRWSLQIFHAYFFGNFDLFVSLPNPKVGVLPAENLRYVTVLDVFSQEQGVVSSGSSTGRGGQEYFSEKYAGSAQQWSASEVTHIGWGKQSLP